MTDLYPDTDHLPVFYSRERLEALAARVPHLPDTLAGMALPSIRSFLSARYGGEVGAFLEQDDRTASITDGAKLAVGRALDVHGQTHLFREAYPLRAIRQVVIPALQSRHPISIASVGCSSGEEPLSILLNNWERRDTLAIEGFDINPELIDEARSRRWYIDDYHSECDPAEYLSKRFDSWAAVEPTAWREAFEMRPGNSKRVRVELHPTPELKARLGFHVHDILLEPLPSKYDVIVLHNVLCHYSPIGRDEILKNVRASLSDGGFLVGDAAHTLGNAARDRETFHRWYDALEHYDLTRVKISVRHEWSQSTADETPAVFVYCANRKAKNPSARSRSLPSTSSLDKLPSTSSGSIRLAKV